MTRSSSWWYGITRWALPETSRRSVSTPREPERVELCEEDLRVDDDAVADDRRDRGVQDPARDQLEGELLAVDHDPVPGVVAALVADDDVHLLREEICELALALITPLGAHHDRCWHALLRGG